MAKPPNAKSRSDDLPSASTAAWSCCSAGVGMSPARALATCSLSLLLKNRTTLFFCFLLSPPDLTAPLRWDLRA